MASPFVTPKKLLLAALVLFSAVFACARSLALNSELFTIAGEVLPLPERTKASLAQATPVTTLSADPIESPTPDPPHTLPKIRQKPDQYVVQSDDNLNKIARRHGVSVSDIVQANSLTSPDHIEAGQKLIIPPPAPSETGSAFKIMPDSELVYGPASLDFNLGDFITSQGGYLAGYSEEGEGQNLTGVRVVQRVAQEYSVNPRLLLAVLEYQSGWVTQPNPRKAALKFPIGELEAWRDNLYLQLAWAANNLNRGYYLWRVNGLSAWTLQDDSVVPIAPVINAATAGVQQFFAQLYGRADWDQAVSESGLFATYNALFGYPFSRAVEPLLPPDVTQPAMQLPFEPGKNWSYTGGPHGGWGGGSAWAALDFAPPGEPLGCVQSDAWVVAVANGLVVRTGNGVVIQDLDVGAASDGYEQTGWTVLYMHVESRDRVAPGTYLRAGERVGHPSCEGGVSTATHLHLARRYNGEWIPADQSLPFVLDGWASVGAGNEYDGYLKKDGRTVEALEGRFPENKIER